MVENSLREFSFYYKVDGYIEVVSEKQQYIRNKLNESGRLDSNKSQPRMIR